MMKSSLSFLTNRLGQKEGRSEYIGLSLPLQMFLMILLQIQVSDIDIAQVRGINQRDKTRSIVVMWVNIFQTEKNIEIQLGRPTEVCGKVSSENNG